MAVSPQFSQSLIERFKLNSKTVLNDVLLSSIIKAVELRLQPLEAQQSTLEAAIDAVRQVGLDRINEVLTPAIEAVLDIQSMGFLIANSTTSNTLAVTSILTFNVANEAQRSLFTPSPFVILTREATPDDYGVARTISYDNQTGNYICEVVTQVGAPGPHNDWVIGALAGSTLAQVAMMEAVETMQGIASAAATTATTQAGIATTKAGEASTSAASALSSWNSIRSRYVGAASSAPTTLPGGGALVTGVSYFDTTLNQIRVYNGAGWTAAYNISPAQISDVTGLQGALDAKASTTDLNNAISALVNGAGAALDTLNELAAALGNDPNFSTTILTTLSLATQATAASTAESISDTDEILFRRPTGEFIFRKTVTNLKAFLNAYYARKGADTQFSADQTISKASPIFALSKSASGQAASVFGSVGAAARWALVLGTTDAESTGDAGSNFALARYNDAGTLVDSVLAITRSSAVASGAVIATLANTLAALSGKLLEAGMIDSAAQPVNLGAALTGNLSLDMATFFNGYGTATGNIVFNAVTNSKWRGGILEITASGGTRTVGFTTGVFCTPDNVPLTSIATGTTMAYSFQRLQMGKIMITELGLVS